MTECERAWIGYELQSAYNVQLKQILGIVGE